MKRYNHPVLDDVDVSELLYALADKTRLNFVRELAEAADPLSCAETAQAMGKIAPSTIHHHLSILRDCGLVHSERQGKKVYNRLRIEELEKRFPGLIYRILEFH